MGVDPGPVEGKDEGRVPVRTLPDPEFSALRLLPKCVICATSAIPAGLMLEFARGAAHSCHDPATIRAPGSKETRT